MLFGELGRGIYETKQLDDALHVRQSAQFMMQCGQQINGRAACRLTAFLRADAVSQLTGPRFSFSLGNMPRDK